MKYKIGDIVRIKRKKFHGRSFINKFSGRIVTIRGERNGVYLGDYYDIEEDYDLICFDYEIECLAEETIIESSYSRFEILDIR